MIHHKYTIGTHKIGGITSKYPGTISVVKRLLQYKMFTDKKYHGT